MKIFLLILFSFFLLTRCYFAQEDFWQPTNGPVPATVLSFTDNNSLVFAGTYGGGVFRSENNGENWRQTGLAYNDIRSLITNYSGYIFAMDNYMGVYRSTDNGDSWELANNGLDCFYKYALAGYYFGYIYAGTDDGVFCSTDNGENWTESGLQNRSVFCLTVNYWGVIFAGVYDGWDLGVYRSTDFGNSWTQINNGLSDLNVWSLATYFGGYVFAGTEGGGIFRSTDNGDNWTSINNGLSVVDVWGISVNNNGDIFFGTWDAAYRSTDFGNSWTQTSPAGVGFINFSFTGSAIIAGAQLGAYRSTDNGLSWTDASLGLALSSISSLSFTNGGDLFAGLYGGLGIYQSTDSGDTWMHTTMPGLIIYSITISINGDIFAGALGGVFRSTDNGLNWTAVNNGLGNTTVLSVAAKTAGEIYAGTAGGVYRSNDNGDTWVQSGLSAYSINTLIIKDSEIIFAGTENGGVFRSTDDGENWTVVNNNLIDPYVNCFAINLNGDIFAGTDYSVARTTDNGEYWIQTDLTNFSVRSLAISSAGDVYAGTYLGGAFYTTDNGLNWTIVNGGLQNNKVYALAINPDGYIFAGTRGNGVFRSTMSVIPVEFISFTCFPSGSDVLLKWQTATETNNDGFEVQRTESDSVRSEVGVLNGWEKIGFVKGNGTTTELKSYSFTDKNNPAANHKYRLKQIDFNGSYKYSDVVEAKINLPDKFSLSQNYPNPFNPTTTINYSIPNVISSPAGRERNLFVTLKVYNVLGEEVATLINEEKLPGVYSVEFNSYSDKSAGRGQSLSSGIYFYQLTVVPNGRQAGSFSSTKKMILLK